MQQDTSPEVGGSSSHTAEPSALSHDQRCLEITDGKAVRSHSETRFNSSYKVGSLGAREGTGPQVQHTSQERDSFGRNFGMGAQVNFVIGSNDPISPFKGGSSRGI